MTKFTNRVRLQRRLQSIAPAVRRALKAQNAINAAELVETVKGFAPVDDGVLKASVKHEDVSDGTKISQRVSAGGAMTTRPVRKGQTATYDYANAAEYGADGSPAHPFFWPAWRLKRRRFKSRMTRAGKKAIQEADPSAAVQNAVEAALRAAAAVKSEFGGTTRLYTLSAPIDAPFPHIVIGEDQVIGDDVPCGSASTIVVTVHVLARETTPAGSRLKATASAGV